MPIYEYRAVNKGCSYCARGFEAIQGVNEEPIERCPRCHRAVERMISPLGRVDVAYTPSDAFKYYCKKMEERQRKEKKQLEKSSEEE